MVKGSRFLNKENGVLGLTAKDLVLSMGVHMITVPLTSPFHLEIVSLILSIAVLAALIPIRAKHREKYFRDKIATLIYRWRYFVS